MLVAHLDTVHKDLVKTICYSADGNIIMSPEGIGGDDRAGIYMILQIIKTHNCHVLLCEDEELGGLGANAFVESSIKPEVNYIVELDRRGSLDAVFYDCDNSEFTRFVTGFGFKKKTGSFSDISIIAPALKVASVNISSGYYNEHSLHEHVDIRVIKKNIELVSKMVSTYSKRFEYIEAIYLYDDMLGFDNNSYGINETEIKRLMQLPELSYIKTPKGRMLESNGEYLLDSSGNVYEYIYWYDVAIKMNDYEAISENGFTIKFNEIEAFEIEIVPTDFMSDDYIDID